MVVSAYTIAFICTLLGWLTGFYSGWLVFHPDNKRRRWEKP